MNCSFVCATILGAATVACGGSNVSGGAGAGTNAPQQAGGGARDTCKLLSQAEVGDAVGNPVKPGEHYAGTLVCTWDPEQRGHVSVLLTIRLNETHLCKELGSVTSGTPQSGVGDDARWKFSNTMGFSIPAIWKAAAAGAT
jgi:hypothetical protein